MDYIIIAVLAGIVIIAILRSIKHFKGGGCCGSGGNTIRDKKSLTAPKIGEKVMPASWTLQTRHSMRSPATMCTITSPARISSLCCGRRCAF